jgi:hypothetical protein
LNIRCVLEIMVGLPPGQIMLFSAFSLMPCK